jgi:hypothetical protein
MRRSARPSTAGRRPPKVKETAVKAPDPVAPAVIDHRTAGILIDGQDEVVSPYLIILRLINWFNYILFMFLLYLRRSLKQFLVQWYHVLQMTCEELKPKVEMRMRQGRVN